MKLIDYLKDNIVIMDGGFGTLLQGRGLKAGEYPERMNITDPQTVISIHREYYDAGADIVCANTFGANSLKFEPDELELIVKSAISNADTARKQSKKAGEGFVALDIGPLGKLLRPFGDFDFESAVKAFAETVKLGEKYGADLIFIETMNDSYETKAAILAAKENSSLPIFVSNAYGADGSLMTGASPAAMVALSEGLGVCAIGANCSLGPSGLKGVYDELLKNSSLPVILKPNAGLPKIVDGKTVFDVGIEEFADEITEAVKKGVRIVGGCCGTTPEYISAVAKAVGKLSPLPIEPKEITAVSSYSRSVELGKAPVLIGERINPTGKKRFKQALRENDIDYILSEGVAQAERGVHILDVNVGLPEIDEAAMLERAVFELQSVIELPLQIDTADCAAMERAMRIYNGKPMINSVNGKAESMAAVFPLVKKYGGVVVALTLDENGIPETAEGRFAIAEKILDTAKQYGIAKKDIIFDTLTLTVSADHTAAEVTLKSLKMISERLGCHTSLGVSNVSFGLPNRDIINSSFFTLALQNGLSAAIMNPYSAEMMKSYYAFKALSGLDQNCAEYIGFAEAMSAAQAKTETNSSKPQENYSSLLQRAVIKGLREQAAEVTKELLKAQAPLDIVNGEIIPALDTVGKGFEEKRVYLPQLLMSAEAASSAFEEIKKSLSVTDKGAEKCPFVLATVKGDIHDIGKNIVKLLLENYGFEVIDLGRDVEPERVLEAVLDNNAPLVGLSALMTTTVPAMEQTVRLIKEKAPFCRVVVGGAVLTAEYANAMGADRYSADAMETVRYAEIINSNR